MAPNAGVREFENLDLAADLVGADQLPLDQKLTNGGLHHLVIARTRLRLNIGVMVIMMALDFGHDQILSSQLSNTSIRRPSRGEPE